MSKMENCCAVQDCLPCDNSEPWPLFQFPLDPERSKMWLENCQRKDLIQKPAEEVHKYYRICGKHFKMDAFDDATQGKVLKDDALPTIFDASTLSPSGPVKRGSDASAEDKESEPEAKKKREVSEPGEVVHIPTETEEEIQTRYLGALFEVLLFLGRQRLTPTSTCDKIKFSDFQGLVDNCLQFNNKALTKYHMEWKKCFFEEKLDKMMEACERHVRAKIVEEVKQNAFFSLLTGDPEKISGEWCLPVFLVYVDQLNCRQEKFVGFLDFEGDGEELAENMMSEMEEKWGLDFDQCRGQAHSSSAVHGRKIKTFAKMILDKYPRAILSFRSTDVLNIWLTNGMNIIAVRLLMITLRRVQSVLETCPQLQLELDQAIALFYPEQEDKANELKKSLRTSWTTESTAFDVAMDIIGPLVFCLESVHNDVGMGWSKEIIDDAQNISELLTKYNLAMSLAVLRNVSTFTQAFGKKLRGGIADVYTALTSTEALLHAVTEVNHNIDLYNKKWFDEGNDLAAALEDPSRFPHFYKRQRRLGCNLLPIFYKGQISAPAVKHILDELKDLFSEEHLKTLRCVSLIPVVMEKFTEPDEQNIHVFDDDLPDAKALPAELKSWWQKWRESDKKEASPSSLHEMMQLTDVVVFPNISTILKILSILPALPSETSCSVAQERFKIYMKNAPFNLKSKRHAVLNINRDVESDVDSLVDDHMKMFPDEQDDLWP